jgi:hypothetical protein
MRFLSVSVSAWRRGSYAFRSRDVRVSYAGQRRLVRVSSAGHRHVERVSKGRARMALQTIQKNPPALSIYRHAVRRGCIGAKKHSRTGCAAPRCYRALYRFPQQEVADD